MTKLQKAIKIINKRLPSSYLIPIKTYKTIYGLLRGYCKIYKTDYNEMVQWYTNYKTNPTTNTYMNTKYWRTDLKFKRNHRIEGFNISAIAGNPILIAENQIENRTIRELVFLIIHEYGHHWLDRHGYDDLNEHWCDEFAIRWVRKFIKEGLIKEN